MKSYNQLYSNEFDIQELVYSRVEPIPWPVP